MRGPREVRGRVVEDFKVGERRVGAVFLGLGDERGPLARARAVGGAGGGALVAAVAGGAGVAATSSGRRVVHFVELVRVFVDVCFGAVGGGAAWGGFHEKAAAGGLALVVAALRAGGGGVFSCGSTGLGGCADGAEAGKLFIDEGFGVEGERIGARRGVTDGVGTAGHGGEF